MVADGKWRPSLVLLGALALSSALACSSNDPIDFGMVGPWGPTPALSCDMTGTWVTYVQVGVEWSSPTIKEGAGKVTQWILSERSPTATGAVDRVRSCGIGATDVPLGSSWFSTRAFPPVLPVEEWTGVTFSPALFDSGLLPSGLLAITMEGGNRSELSGNERIQTAIVPFQHGTEGIPDDVWPSRQEIVPYLVDHDADGLPGLTGSPFVGPVPGAVPSTEFQDPRLDVVNDPPARTNALYMAIRTRAQLDLRLTSCDPPRFEGFVVPGTLLIETSNVACKVTGTEEPCTEEQVKFIDDNLPQFNHNGTSRVIAVKAPPDMTCERARRLDR